jgi:predicted NAD/FAD-binding protein
MTASSLNELPPNSRVAVVGAGVAGLTAAWLISQRHQVELIEKNDYLGGHTCTLRVPQGPDEGLPVDAGFIVMNHRNYPQLTRVFERLEVELGDSDMSFGFRCESSGYAYAGTNLAAMFAQTRNLFRRHHWGMLTDILRFNHAALKDLENGSLQGLTLGAYIQKKGYGTSFADHYLLAMGSPIWSSPCSAIREHPAEPFIEFFKNHGLLGIKHRPQWRYVRNGSQTYVTRMMEQFKGSWSVSKSIRGIERNPDGVRIHFDTGQHQEVDYIVLAAHADESLALLDHPTPAESRGLGAWTYQLNKAVFHSDESIMPRERKAWASWNFLRASLDGAMQPVSVTYHMNRLQDLKAHHQYFVSLNVPGSLDESKVWERRNFYHPVYDFSALASQSSLPNLNGDQRTWFCGSYFGNGFHEAAVQSAVDVAADFGVRV